MAGDTFQLQRRVLRGLQIEVAGLIHGDAELALFQSRGDIAMGTGVHVGIDPQGNRRTLAHVGGNVRDTPEFGRGFHIEAEDSGVEGGADFDAGLADAGKNDFAGIAARTQHPLQLTARDNIEARAHLRKNPQDAEIAVGLDRITDLGIVTEGSAEGVIALAQRRFGIDVTGRTVMLRYLLQGEVFAIKGVIAVVKRIHGAAGL